MDTLQQIFEKLNNTDKYFTKIYDITIEDIWKTEFIRVKRKSLQMDESYTYSTDLGMNYNNNDIVMCFDIFVERNYFFLTELRVIACRFNKNSEHKFGYGMGKEKHIQNIALFHADITAIMKFISDMEHEINQDNFQKNDFLAVNEYRCKDCQCKMRI
jgi:hypothetical protein